MSPERFSYLQAQGFPGLKSGLPYLPLTLRTLTQAVTVSALVDSGATVNVLPHDVGLRLGLRWERQMLNLAPVGFLRGAPAYGVKLIGEIAAFPPVNLVFAWTQKTSQELPVILGQMNFFQEFRVIFDGKENTFEVMPYV